MGRVLKRLQREGVQRCSDAHAKGLERQIREDDYMGIYAHLKRVNLETLVSLARSSSETSRGACCETRRRFSNDGRGTPRRFETTHHQRSIPQS